MENMYATCTVLYREKKVWMNAYGGYDDFVEVELRKWECRDSRIEDTTTTKTDYVLSCKVVVDDESVVQTSRSFIAKDYGYSLNPEATLTRRAIKEYDQLLEYHPKSHLVVVPEQPEETEETEEYIPLPF